MLRPLRAFIKIGETLSIKGRAFRVSGIEYRPRETEEGEDLVTAFSLEVETHPKTIAGKDPRGWGRPNAALTPGKKRNVRR